MSRPYSLSSMLAGHETPLENEPIALAKPYPGSSADEKMQDAPYRDVENSIDLATGAAGFLVVFDGDDDSRNPRSLSSARKWLIVLIVSSTSLCVACTSSIYAEAYSQITADFHVSEEVATLGLGLFVVGLGLSPMMLAPLSEFYGRKPIYIVSLAFFVIWIVPCAVAHNIETFLIARFIDGFAGAAFLSVAGGTVGDLFPKQKLQAPMMIYTVTPFLGPQLGPIIGGFIDYYTNWRWTFWVLLIWAGVQWILVTSLVPETYHPVLLRSEARKMRRQTGDTRYHAAIEKTEISVAQTLRRSIHRPFLLLAMEPMCPNLCIYCSLLLGILYLFFGAFDLVFTNNHGFNLWQVGLSFLGITVGILIGISTNPFWHKNYMRLLMRHVERTGETGSDPEYRLPPAIGGAPLITIGLLWFGWTTYANIHWIVPIIGSAFFGAGIIMVFSGVFTFLVDAYPMYAASALAANSFTRSMFAAAFPLFGNIMFERMGYQWATFTLAMISLAMAPLPLVFYRYGKSFRARSKYAGQR